MIREIPGLLLWQGITFLAGGIGSMATLYAGSYYQELARPSWAPPPYLFGPVWTVLYLLMGLSAWLIFRDPKRAGEEHFWSRNGALALYLLQLGVNALWSWLFFGWRRSDLAFIDTLVLLFLLLALTVVFWRIRPLAALLIIPCLLWVTFASALNFSLLQLNPLSP